MSFEGLEISVAGGLFAENIGLLSDLDFCPYLGIDAQSGLRNKADDSLNLNEVEKYLQASFDLFYSK